MKKALYLGLHCVEESIDRLVTHYPIISIHPRPKSDPMIVSAFQNFEHYSDLIFTSKTALTLFFGYAPHFGIEPAQIGSKIITVVGKSTAAAAARHGLNAAYPPKDETAEGLAALLSQQDLSGAYFFWPHSALSRSILPAFFKARGIKFCDCIFYDTYPNRHLPPIDLNQFDEIIFTSPSTVDAFKELLGEIPMDKQITAIGPVTQAYLNTFIRARCPDYPARTLPNCS